MYGSIFDNTTEEYQTTFVDVILPLNLKGLYTYSVAEDLLDEIAIGKRVVVPFGKNKRYSALIVRLHQTPPELYKTKCIDYVLDDYPIATLSQIKFWTWLSQYYSSSLGEIYRTALPAGLKLESEINISLDPNFKDYDNLLPKELDLIQLLQKADYLNINEAAKMMNRKHIYPLVQSLQQKSAIILSEDFKQKYKAKTISYVQITTNFNDNAQIENAFSLCKNSPKQENALLWYIKESKCFTSSPIKISKKRFHEAGFSPAILSALQKKGILEIVKEEVGRFILKTSSSQNKKSLSSEQETAYQSCIEHFKNKKPVLLFGVAASGKTEIYIHLIEEQLKKGKTCLYLLPEISLSSQIVERLSEIFGEQLIIYHSRLSDNQRVEIWQELLKGKDAKYKLILGVRSSIFLPFTNLGLIVVDEEHENAYKQFQPSPRYQARDSAIYLAQQMQSAIVLGSSTPSIESFYNAQNKKFALVELQERYQNSSFPVIEVIDTKEAARKKEMYSHFSKQLIKAIEEVLKEKKQVILFQNRRGYAPMIECQDCGWIPECEHCNVKLTYYKKTSDLRCHYCGYSIDNLTQCMACSGKHIQAKGFGTEKIEDELKIYFPKARIARLDLETTRRKNASLELLHQFENQEIDILVGTQMITKGLHFSNVKLSVVLNADNLLNFPDFRAEERCFQIIQQVAGRAGRSEEQGRALVQTMQINHPIIKDIQQHDYQAMFTRQIIERQSFYYPPFVRLIEITLKHKDADTVFQAADLLANEIKSYLKETPVLGPQAPIINRIQNQFLQNIIIKLTKDKSLQAKKDLIANRIDALKSISKFRSVIVINNIDPY